MTRLNLAQANIDNLTQLWNLMGMASIETKTAAKLSASIYWPKRLWFNWGHYPTETDIDTLLLAGEQDALQMIIPLWHEDDVQFKKRLQQAEYRPLFEQTAMVLHMDEYKHQHTGDITMTEVSTAEAVTSWTDIAATAFGYDIQNPSLDSLVERDDVRLFLVWQDKHPVGTALTYETGELVGLHQVGVLPDYRGRGIARKMMVYLLNRMDKSDTHYVTLQASALGEALYRQLGFEKQFTITNYCHQSLMASV